MLPPEWVLWGQITSVWPCWGVGGPVGSGCLAAGSWGALLCPCGASGRLGGPAVTFGGWEAPL